MQAELYNHAIRTLGHSFLSLAKIRRSTDFSYTSQQVERLHETFFSAKRIELAGNRECVLLPTPPYPLSLVTLRSKFSSYLYHSHNPWYLETGEDFVRSELPPATWIAVRRTKVQTDRSKNRYELENLIGDMGLVMAPAVAVVYMMVMYKVVERVSLFSSVQLRTACVAKNGMRVTVGPYGDFGIPISKSVDTEATKILNVAAMLPY